MIGIGLRQPHYRQVLEAGQGGLGTAEFFEVHSENFFAPGGAARAVLRQVRERFPVSLHGVGLGLGNAHGISGRHLATLKQLVDETEPILVSEHVCWTAVSHGADQIVLNDLLPMPHTLEALGVLVSHIDQTQETLGRRILIENATAYLRFAGDEFDEMSFIAGAAKRSGCGILLDLNNLYINSVHFGFDPVAAFKRLPVEAVQQFHLAGHQATELALIDDHGSPVKGDVWDLYHAALQHFGPRPCLIEWDTAIPPLDVLLGEAAKAAALSLPKLPALELADVA
jgi:uncharacterized protein (UPF0276 family)